MIIDFWKIGGKFSVKLPNGFGDSLHLSVTTSLMVYLGIFKSEPKMTGLTCFHSNRSSLVVFETEMKMSEVTSTLWTIFTILLTL